MFGSPRSTKLRGREAKQESLRLLDTLAGGASSEPNGTGVDRRSIWEIIEEINGDLPKDTRDDVPADGSINLDHYLYGAPKQDRESCLR